MTVPNYSYACVPEQANVTINQTNLSLDGVATYFRTYSTRDSSISFSDGARTIIVLPTTPVDADAVGVFDAGVRMALGTHYTISGQILTLLASFPTNHQLDVVFMSTTPGSVSNAVQPGIIVTFSASLTVPDGWLRCDGSAVSRTTYAALFAVIGTTYGAGNGTTTFNLPNTSGTIVKT